MKKIVLSILCLLTLCFAAHAQFAARPTAQIDLHGNQVRARLLNGGDLFWDLSHAHFETDTSSPGVSAMFVSSIWIGGYDSGGNLKTAAQTYRQSGNDFWPGPIDANGTTTPVISTQWDKIWHITGMEVRQFIDDWNNHVVNACTSLNMFKWPGRNNPHSLQENGFALPLNQDFAPFFDLNNDGIYNPDDGDYPIVPNTNGSVIADDLAWTVFNDDGG